MRQATTNQTPALLSALRGIVFAVAALAAFAAPGEPPASAPAAASAEELRARVAALVVPEVHGPAARLGLYVSDTRTGREVLSIAADEGFMPASLLKLATAAAALDTLGADRRFETTLEVEGYITAKGVLEGDLRIRGGGDPSFGPRYQVDRTDTTRVLRQWAEDVRATGIREITGRIIGDDSLFEDDRFGPGWPGDQRAEWYAAEVSALSFNDNTIDVVISGTSRPRERSRMKLRPDTAYAPVVNSVRTVSPLEDDTWVRFFRTPKGMEIVARGRVRAGETREEYAAVRDPAWYTAYVFAEQLGAAGVRLSREAPALPARLMKADETEDTTATLVLSRQTSPPIGAMMPAVLGVSQNLYAEVLLRHVALALGEPASFRGGGLALQEWMNASGIPTAGAIVVDGSGLSRINRLTPRQIGRVLEAAARKPWAATYRAALPEPGGAGSLRSRFTPEERIELRGRLRAKTGTLDGVQGLAGYLASPWGGDYTFVIVLNGSAAPLEVQRRLVEQAALQLARSSALP
jgi:D-alanyl-D-alanine carboxypeptidase/D-alanyl-D-alanine-endopeptidase (penicillin-binding protein 4)